MRSLPAFLYLLLLSIAVHAQTNDPRDFFLIISSVESIGEQQIKVTTSYGESLDIEEGMDCYVWGLHYSEFPTHNETTLAEGKISEVTDTSATAILTVLDTAEVKQVYRGDMLAVSLSNNGGYQGLLYDMIDRSIYFTDQEENLYYYFFSVFDGYSQPQEEETLEYMAEDIRDLAESLIGEIDDQDLEGGLFDGQTMLGAMTKTSARDLASFLLYVSEWPGKYMGKSWKITETYATWLINATPIAEEDFYYLIDDLKSEEELTTFVSRYGPLLDADMVLDLGIRAENLAEAGDSKEAHAFIDKVINVSERLADLDMMGWAYFHKARIYWVEDQEAEIPEWYEKAAEQFENSGATYGQSITYNNLGSAYNTLEQWEKAVEYYQKAVKVKGLRYKEDRSNDNFEDIAFSQYGLGDSYMENGDYTKAERELREAISIYRSTRNIKKVISTLEYLANNFAKQGLLDQAIAIHQERISYDDPESTADAIFDIGYVYNGYGEDFEKAIPYYKQSYDLHMALGDTSMAALSISNVAQSYWSLKELEKSITFHEQTIQLAEAFGEKDRIANSWDKLADLYSENGNPKKSLAAYDKVIELYAELEDPKLAETINEVGDVYKDAKDFLKAISYYKQSLQLAEENNNYVQSSDALFEIANCYYTDTKYELARKFYMESMEEAAKTDYPSQEIYCLSNIAMIYSLKDQFEVSDSIYQVALTKAEVLEDNNIVAYCKYCLAGTASRQRDYDKTEKLYNEALNLYRDLEDREWEVITLNSLSGIYSNRGDFDRAFEVLDEALRISTEENDRNNIANAYAYKADLYVRIKGEFDKAWEMQTKSMELFEEVDNRWGMASSNIGFGNIKNLSGEYAQAVSYYQIADSLYQSLGNEYSRATTSNNIGSIYFWQGDYEKSLVYFQKAIDILDSLGIKDAARSMYVSNIGAVYFEQKVYDTGESKLMEALKDAREIDDVNQISTNLTYLGKLKTETGDFQQAKNYLQEGLKIQEKLGLETHKITANLALGILGYLTKAEDTEQYVDKSIELCLKMHSDRELWEAYYYKGLIARDAGNLTDSKEHLINAIETLEKIQSKVVGGAKAKKLFASGEKQIMVYATLVDVLILKGEIELALQYLERSNVESLRNKFSQLDINFKDETSNQKLKEEKELKKKLDNLDRTIAEAKSGASSEEQLQKLQASKTIAENEYLKFVNKTINTNPELSRHFSGGFHPRKLKTDKNRRLIPKELVVLSYLPANDKLYIFAATSDTVIAKVVNVPLEELNKNIQFIYNFASFKFDGHQTDELRVVRGDQKKELEGFNTAQSKYKNISEQLFDWTIAPVKSELDKKSTVVVIPTGMLHFLPFQMLGETQANGKFDFLIEHYTLFYAHSLEMLYQHGEKPEELSILAMANADRTLPAAQDEVMELKKLFPNTDVFIHEQASEDKAKSHGGKHNVLHFATHGNLDYYDYNKSYLTLAPNADGTEDGKLTIEEVWEIEDIYEYQMVTLSACETAVTDDFSSGWAVSPATSFIDAGAPTVVASLWAVNDASTGLLMEYFYRNTKTMSKVEALRHAQIELAQNEKFNHPYYWAPFILIGDWR